MGSSPEASRFRFPSDSPSSSRLSSRSMSSAVRGCPAPPREIQRLCELNFRRISPKHANGAVNAGTVRPSGPPVLCGARGGKRAADRLPRRESQRIYSGERQKAALTFHTRLRAPRPNFCREGNYHVQPCRKCRECRMGDGGLSISAVEIRRTQRGLPILSILSKIPSPRSPDLHGQYLTDLLVYTSTTLHG